ncbi:MAG: coproporphyrinogen III oxidase family protein [Verrucomicrobia bacterium]|nr:coproporphyrinogen III oxidase family protein [Verrucomicrobiota bacterium]
MKAPASDATARWLGFAARHAPDFTIQYPPRREYFQQRYRSPLGAPDTRDWMPAAGDVLLYLHVPFCEAKCYYCNFAVDVSSDADLHRRYVDALLVDLERHRPWLERARVRGIDVGGGTPTRLGSADLTRLGAALRPFADPAHPWPLSLETTPRIAATEPEKMQALRAAGFGRVSMGVQSFHAATLAAVNRQAQVDQTAQAMAHLRAAGFARINLDVIFALPGQTLADWDFDLAQLIALQPDSITTYDCLYRGKGRALTRRTSQLPGPDVYGAMYDHAFARLTAAGWHAPYGSVNFAREPRETGTSAYFEGRLLDGLPYLGLGNYATSLRGHRWSFNVRGVRSYLRQVAADASTTEDCYDLPPAEVMAKQVLLSLNFGFIDPARFARQFGVDFEEVFAEPLACAVAAGWLQRAPDACWRLAPGAFSQLPLLRALFYPPAARAWLESLDAAEAARAAA